MMKELSVLIEIDGQFHVVGYIRGNDANDAQFEYSDEYLSNDQLLPISISLPKNEGIFAADRTRYFFDGLLPEGFVRRSIAGNMHVDEGDYLSILQVLGRECIGALKISDSQDTNGYELYKKLSLEQVKALAKEGARKSAEIVTETRLSLAGASGKVGLMYYCGEWYQPMHDAASSHIVKQSHVRLDSVVLNEHLCMKTAKILGIDAVDSFVINVGHGKDEDVLFASKRYDRKICDGEYIGSINKLSRLHQEDFSQALGIPAINKYENNGDEYLLKMFDLLRKYSANPVEDMLKLWDLMVFNYLIGNTDNHIKNHGLLYSSNMQSIRLAPAYDILSTCIYDECTRKMSICIGDKTSLDEINRNSFAEAAREIGLGVNMAMKHFDSMAEKFESSLWKAVEAVSNEGFGMAEEIGQRIMGKCGYVSL